MRVAVVGAGPVGLEAALQARNAGHEVQIFECQSVGAQVQSWGKVRMFTPWSMNVSREAMAFLGQPSLPANECPTGEEWAAQYLIPLGRKLGVKEDHRVLGVARTFHSKGSAIGSKDRWNDAFRLLVSHRGAQFYSVADIVLDCSGLSEPGRAGPGGLAAIGEAELHQKGVLRYGVSDPRPGRWLVVGDGASACSQVLRLLAEGAAITWITRDTTPGFVSPSDDPLPERRVLWRQAAAALESSRVRLIPGGVLERLESVQGDHTAILEDGTNIPFDWVAVCTGRKPDLALFRELQVHLCYATEGPMRLAAALLGSGNTDCLSAPMGSVDLLQNPEPGFYVLGSKSYGRRTDFLVLNGYAQAVQVQQHIELALDNAHRSYSEAGSRFPERP